MKVCWCGHAKFLPFNAQYGVCANCGTLVSQQSLTDDQLVVVDDETAFYGKQYWLGHQADDLGFPDIHARARRDLTERNLHWLRTLLKYMPPPATTLELGCAHGSFVAMMERAGYASSGVEMSPWVVEYGRETFGIDIRTGPIEDLDIAPGSLDVIALMDVLEHLPDPLRTMRHCLDLLKPAGLLLVQTPKFEAGAEYARLVADGSPFLEQLKADEHLFLFTEHSVKRLFRDLQATHIAFEPAIFAMYDMFLVVGRTPLRVHSEAEVDAALLATPSGRFTLALLDLRARELALADRAGAADADRTARGAQVVELTALLHESEADRTARGAQVVELTALLHESEADRKARAERIDVLNAMLDEAEADRTGRGAQVVTLTEMLRESEADREARAQQIDALNAMLSQADADRTGRGVQVEALTAMLRESEADRAARAGQIDALSRLAAEAEVDKSALDGEVRALNALLRDADTERAELIERTAAAGDELARCAASIELLTAAASQRAATLAMLQADLRRFLSRREVRLLARAMKWPEVPKLEAGLEADRE